MRDLEKQRAYMREYWKRRGGCHVAGSAHRKFCECGNPAAKLLNGYKVCERCFALDSKSL